MRSAGLCALATSVEPDNEKPIDKQPSHASFCTLRKLGLEFPRSPPADGKAGQYISAPVNASLVTEPTEQLDTTVRDPDLKANYRPLGPRESP